MATIRPKDGKWQVQIRRKGHGSITRTFTKKTDANKWASIVESEIERGVFVDRTEAEGTTLSEALDRYEVEVSVMKKTHSKERSIIKSLKASRLGGLSLAQVKQVEVAKYRDARLKVRGAATVRNELALLSHLFTVASKEWGIGIQNPVLMIRKPAPVRARDRRLSADELDLIIETTESPELPVVIRLLTETAMRRGELSKLRWEHIDLKKATAILFDTKNGEDRVVPLSSRAVAALRSLPRRIDGKVIGMTADAVTRAFGRACARAGIEDARIHDLRHEGVSRLFERGLDLMEVSSISGHKTLSQLKRYTHLSAERLAKKLG
ncbi:site-specific integrase [Sideroxyarcus sp. TK5]